MGEDFKKYDTEDTFEIAGVRLAKDAETREVGDSNLTTLTFVSTSRADSDSDLWVEAKVADRQSDLAAFLKKGDVLHKVVGKPVMRRYGDNNEKFSFQLKRASMVVPLTLLGTLKERGWVPGAKPAGDFKGVDFKKRLKTPTPARRAANTTQEDFDDEIPF